MSQTIKIEKYISDGPGYCGDIEFFLDGNAITQRLNRKSGGSQITFKLPIELPELSMSYTMDNDDAPFIKSALAVGDRGFADTTPETIEQDHVKMLTFVDGTKGFLMVFGEPCYFTLAVGRHVFEFADDSLNDKWELDATFNAEPVDFSQFNDLTDYTMSTEYTERVMQLEAEELTTSDAQGCAEAEYMKWSQLNKSAVSAKP